MAPATQFELSSPPNDAISSLVFAPSSPHLLLVSSWDKTVSVYDTFGGPSPDQETEDAAPRENLVRRIEHPAPILDVCFGASDDSAYSACLDWCVRHLDLSTGESTIVSRHAAPVRRVVYSAAHNLLISASWDGTLRVHSLSSSSSSSSPSEVEPLTITLPAKPQALAASPSKLVVAMAARLVHIYELADLATAAASPDPTSSPPPKPWQERESSLKFLTRAVAAMPSDAGYATSSIEGRVAVEWFDASAESQARKYAFKCHRSSAAAAAAAADTKEGGGGGGSGEKIDVVYPVNALAFHPQHTRTFASGGGDATVALWDAEAKRRMKIYQKFADSVAGLAFSCDGRFLAAGLCPGFETGMEEYCGEGRARVVVRELGESEAKGKAAK